MNKLDVIGETAVDAASWVRTEMAVVKVIYLLAPEVQAMTEVGELHDLDVIEMYPQEFRKVWKTIKRMAGLRSNQSLKKLPESEYGKVIAAAQKISERLKEKPGISLDWFGQMEGV